MNLFICSGLFRIALPAALLAGVLFRQNFFSLIYLLLLFISPLLPGPTAATISSGHTGRYLRAVLCLSLIICIAQIVFQITLLSLGNYGALFDYCDWKGKVIAAVGLHQLNDVRIIDGFRLVGLDFLVLLVSAFVHVMCLKLAETAATSDNPDCKGPVDESVTSASGGGGPQSPDPTETTSPKPKHTRRRKRKASELLVFVGEFILVVFYAAAGIIQPSLLSSVYFLLFLGVSTWLACNRRLGRTYMLSRMTLLVYSALHFIAVFLYQTMYAQELIPSDGLYARLVGLTALRNATCDNARTISFEPLSWTVYVSPLVVLGLYWVLATVSRYRVLNPVVEETASDISGTVAVGSNQSSQKSNTSLLRRRKTVRRERAKSECMPYGISDDYGQYGECHPLTLSTPVYKNRVFEANSFSVEDTPLLGDERTPKSYKTLDVPHRHSLAVDPNGSMTWTSESEMPDGSGPPDEGTVVSGGATMSKYRSIILSPLVSILRLIAKGSYVGTLIIMMTWSITYHSWLTFLLLLWSCVLWMTPNSRQACLKSSPFLVAYSVALLLLQYVYGLNLNDAELPVSIDQVNLEQIGLKKYHQLSYQPIAVKILYTVMFWLTLHQYMQERAKSVERDLSHGVMLEPFNISYSTAQPGAARPSDVNRQMSEVSGATVANPFVKKVGAIVTTLLTKYWIWVVACMLMVISLGGDQVVLYRIAYMFLFLFFISMFQFSYTVWRRVMYGFWLTMIMYSMLVLLLIYTYQFEGFQGYWANYLHVSLEIQSDIGLEIYNADPGTLFLKLLTPTFFLIITIIQLHYFHKDFLKISEIDYIPEATPATDLRSPSTQITIDRESVSTAPGAPSTLTAECSMTPSPAVLDEKEMEEKDRDKYGVQEMKEIIEKNWNKVVMVADSVCEFIWRILEIHIIKIVLFSILCLAAYDVCAIHFIFVVFVVLALPVKRLRIFLSHACSLWVSILLLSKMIYQLKFVDQYGWKVNCTDSNDTEEIDNRVWIGFQKTNNLTSYCKGYIGLIIVLTIQAVVRIRQMFHRHRNNEAIPKPGIVFQDVNRAMADDGLAVCAKFLINHFFYKFGVEFCFVTIVACVGVRLDIFAVFSAIWLCIMFLMKRSTLAKIWPFYVTYQCIVLPIQYIMCVGIPRGLCIDYPWSAWAKHELVEWLYLPDFKNEPNAYKIMVDFFQLIFACCQLYVFSIETSPVAEMYEGGSNKEIYSNDSQGLTYYASNPVPDFVTYNKSYLDVIKSLCFFAFYWVTLAIMFLAGTSRVSLFAMGYMVGCFIFLWSGNEFYLKPIRILLKMWNVLLAYNVTVILIKSILQVVGCVFLSSLYKNFCWLVQLLGIACLKKLKSGDAEPVQSVGGCDVPMDEAGLLWDGICFAFLLLQKRLFCSYYFQHLVNEIRAQQVLASRGAEMINEIQMKEVKAQSAVEIEVMQKIKKKMDKIRATHQKSGPKELQPDTHFRAIRSGDYYMFDDYSDEEIDLDLIAKTSKDVEDEEAAEVKEKGINALLSQAMKGTIRQNIRKGSEDDDDIGDSSNLSPIISADRSTEQSSVPHPPLSHITSLSLPDTLPPIISAQAGHGSGQSLPPYDSSHPTESDRAAADRRAPGDEKLVDKIKSLCAITCAFVEGLLISGTAKLNTVSKDYRYVACQLSREKKILKEKFDSGEQSEDLSILEKDIRKATPSAGSISTKAEGKKVAITLQKGSQDLAESVELLDTPDILDQKEQPPIIRFLVAFYYAIVSRSELLCYLMIVVNVMKYASITSLPLALLAFLWGSLSVPRPSKSFWITIITYTEAIVIIKYLFQFNFFPWNSDPDVIKPFWPPRIIGVEKQSHYVVYDLALLLVVFFHRFMLKSLGLWKDSDRSTIAANTPDKTLDEDESLIVDLKEDKDEKAEAAKLKNYGDEDSRLLDGEEEEVDEEESACSEPSPFESLYNKINRLFDPCRSFFRNLLNPEYRVTVDVYAFMFFCDFINFLILVFGNWAFGTGGAEDGVAAYFQENKVPIPFLIMLIVQFALIVMDRALYLRKYIFGKFLFHIFLVFLVHIWMFFILPAVSERRFTSDNNLPPKLFYFIKCGYLLLSAYQIRSGYPTRILGNFFCKKFNYINLFLYKGYLFVPFLYELRCLMDWIWTDTSMNIGNWLKMEDIFSNIFVLKCNRRAEEEYPTPRGSKRTMLVKYGVGGALLLVIILIIWFPLLLFALGSTVGLPNTPLDFSVVLSIGGYEPIFKMSAQRNNMILGLNDYQYNSMRQYNTKSAQLFLNNFDGSDITVINLNGNSTAVWAVSPPSQSSLITELLTNSELSVKLSWSLYRDPNSTGVDKSVGYETSVKLSQNVKTELAHMLNSSETGEAKNVTIINVFPNYLKASARGIVKFETGMTTKNDALRNLTLSLRHGSFQNSSAIAQWWEVRDPVCTGPGSRPYQFLDKNRKCEFLQTVLFSDKVFPSELSIFSGYGIVGLYTTFVLLVSRLVRGFVAGSSFTIMFDDMPYVDRVLQLCLDIYLVRESGEYTLEEDLFAKLIFLYRSPETLIKWTRNPDQSQESPT